MSVEIFDPIGLSPDYIVGPQVRIGPKGIDMQTRYGWLGSFLSRSVQVPYTLGSFLLLTYLLLGLADFFMTQNVIWVPVRLSVLGMVFLVFHKASMLEAN